MGEIAGSVLCLLAVLTTLVAVDVRVRDRVALLFSGASGDTVASWSYRLGSLGDAVVQAVRDLSIGNGPMVVFTVVAAVLVLFMLRT